LTDKGQLTALLQKAGIQKSPNWDGKWRVLVFDIPEGSRGKRDQFRALLKRHNFVKLQASVFISPYSLNQEAVQYLKQTGLIEFIRLMRVDEIDDDRELKKKFKLDHSLKSRP
jgi:phenylacetic acid degradation operon negative regulatory protein